MNINPSDQNTFMYLVNKELNEAEKIFKLSSALLNAEGRLVVKFIINADTYDKVLTEQLRDKMDEIVGKIIPSDFEFIVLYEKSISTPEYIERLVMEFIYNDSPLVFPKIQLEPISVELMAEEAKIKMVLPQYLYSFMTTSGIDKRLISFVESKIMESVSLNIVSSGKRELEIKKKRVKKYSPDTLKVISVENAEKFIGAIAKPPRYIAEICQNESENRTICGKVSNINKIISKKTGVPFFTFRLCDTTATMSIKYFPYDEAKANAFEEKVVEDTEILAEGAVKFDTYEKDCVLIMKKCAFCSIDYSSIVSKSYKEENEDYITIQPNSYIDDEQFDMFGGEMARELIDNTYVVFDLETTGINASQDRIIEIGAVKMEKGLITQTFTTLINPQIKIPSDASRVNNIFDADVENSPLWSEVVADFYKFTRGAILVGHNVSFDLAFLTRYGQEEGYNFDNESVDTLRLSREKLNLKSHKLESLCKEFKIDLNNAHRALFDAVATAKLFKKLLS